MVELEPERVRLSWAWVVNRRDIDAFGLMPRKAVFLGKLI